MPKQTKYTFVCDICGEEYTNKVRSIAESKAQDCEESHDIIYVPLSPSDLQRLLSFIVSKQDEYLTESLVHTLEKYRRLK